MSNDCMPKNKETGMVEITKGALDPDNNINKMTLYELMGHHATQVPVEKEGEVRKWFKDLKALVGEDFRDQICDQLEINCSKLDSDYCDAQELQEAWGDAMDHESRLEIATLVIKLFSFGYFSDRVGLKKPNWKYAMERYFMDLNGLAYLPQRASSKKEQDGGIARQVSRAKADVMKNINRKGRHKTHGYIITTVAGKLYEKPADYKYERKKKVKEGEESVQMVLRVAGTQRKGQSSGRKEKKEATKKDEGTLVDPRQVSVGGACLFLCCFFLMRILLLSKLLVMEVDT
jgi:hypothetical protein